MRKTFLFAVAACALLTAPAHAQEISLKGAIDIHVHQDPDSAPRAIDADDVARQAKAAGMRAIVLKNHWEDTASLDTLEAFMKDFTRRKGVAKS